MSALPSPVTLPPGGGLLLVDKPSGPTSHDVVGRVRAVLGTRKVGHAGTLDPMATGLLVIAVDRCTKLLGHLALTDKRYTATIRLGQATDTDDAQGTVNRQVDATDLSDRAIDAEIEALTGRIAQVPSSVSAIKVDGRRAYERVRSGETPQLTARPVVVSRFDRLGALRRANQLVDVDVQVECSTGTYIRALARDLGAALGVGGHLTALRRTRVGPFDVAAAIEVYPPEGAPGRGEPRAPITDELRGRAGQALLPAAKAAAAAFATRAVDAAAARDLSFGRSLPPVGMPGTYAAVNAAGDRLLALLTESAGQARPVVVFEAS